MSTEIPSKPAPMPLVKYSRIHYNKRINQRM